MIRTSLLLLKNIFTAELKKEKLTLTNCNASWSE